MPEAPPLTLELALRVESLVGKGLLQNARNERGPSRASTEVFGSTVAIKAKSGRTRNDVLCFGLDDLPMLDAILDFYASDALEPRFYLSPMRFHPTLGSELAKRGFGQTRFEQAILYGAAAETPVQLPPSISIERVRADTLDEYLQALGDGFEWHEDWRDSALMGIRRTFGEDSRWYLARFEGEPTAVGSISVPEEGAASLGGAAVVPRFRRMGLHTALLWHRLHEAHLLGCALVTGSAHIQTSSYANQQRAGLRLAYVESQWERLPK